MSQSSEEEYIGGLESGRMLRAGGIAGYGIYATTRRLIGVKSRKALFKQMAGAPLGGLITAVAGARLSRDESARVISELEEKKDLEVQRDDISGLELKKPSFTSRGHMVIETVSGDPVKILFADKGDFQKVVTLMQAFRPEVVNMV